MIGTRAVNKVNLSEWGKSPTEKKVAKPRGRRVAKEIVNQIFMDCSSLATDEFWKEKLVQCAYGKMPAKFAYTDGKLIYKKNNKSPSIELSENRIAALKEIIDFFKKNGGIFSPNDTEDNTDIDSNRIVTEINWSKCNAKMKEILLSYYISDLKSILKLTDKQTKYLKFILNDAIATKAITKNHVIIEDDLIKDITVLVWNPETGFDIVKDKKKRVVRATKKKVDKKLGTKKPKAMTLALKPYWVKYAKSKSVKMGFVAKTAARTRAMDPDQTDCSETGDSDGETDAGEFTMTSEI